MQTNSNWKQFDTQYIWHPYTQMQLAPEALPVVRASGSYLYLEDGSTLFDAISSWWLTLHGHAHPAIAQAIATQAATLEQVIFAGFAHEPAAVLAQKLIERTPKGLAKIFFSDDGSTAVEVALKMCLQYWLHHGEQRPTFLAVEGAYHGDTFGAMSASARGTFTDAFAPLLFDVIHLPFPTPPEDGTEGFSSAEEEFLKCLKREVTSNPSVAGFIYEPLLQGAGGMKTWRPAILREALLMAREANILTIADEVLTGFGRTGTFFASDTVEITPDLMTLSKGLTGGFLPMGITLATEAIYNAFLSNDRSKTFFHGHSYTGNPIACAAGVASLSIFEHEPVFERIAAINRTHKKYMPQLAERLGYRYRILGTMAAMEPKLPEGYLSDRSREMATACRAQGLLIRPLGDTIYLLPPYSSTKEDIATAYQVIEKSWK